MGLTSDFSWWQLWSCHLAHWDARHLLLNVAAAIPPLLFVRPARILAGALLAAPLLSLAILAFGLDGEYRGASGLVVALWVYAGLRGAQASGRLEACAPSLVLLAAIAVKLIGESAGWWPSASASYTALPLAHYAGALIGAAATLFAPCMRSDSTTRRLHVSIAATFPSSARSSPTSTFTASSPAACVATARMPPR